MKNCQILSKSFHWCNNIPYGYEVILICLIQVPKKNFLHGGNRSTIARDAQLLSVHFQLSKQKLKPAMMHKSFIDWNSIDFIAFLLVI